MKQRLYLLFTLLVTAWLSATAYNFRVNGIAYNINNDGKSVTITYTSYISTSNYSGRSGNLVIPEKVTYSGKDYSVTAIGEYAFAYCSRFTGSLIIPNSVTYIGISAFAWCTGFTGSLTIPNSVTSIGDYAFNRCSGFTGSLNIPNSVTSIGESAFYKCSGFNGSLTIPNSVTSIGDDAFYGCSGFTGSLTIPNSVTSIGRYTFDGCYGLTGSLTIPNSVTSIGNYAFYGCSGLNSLTIPNSVTNIDDYAFGECYSLMEIHSKIKQPGKGITYGRSIFYKAPIGGILLFIPKGTKTLYNNTSPWNQFINIVEEDDSGINDIKVDATPTVDVYFNLHGQRVFNPTPGIYIHNGKKELVR